MGRDSFPGIPKGATSGAACAEPLGDHACSPPLPLRPTPAKPASRPQRSAASRRRDRTPEARAPEGGHDPLWATHQVEGSFHYFHRPRGKRRPEEGERRRRGTWRKTVVKGATQRRWQLPLSAPREPAVGAEGATNAPLPPPVARRGPAPCAAGTHASWRHTWLVQGGSEDRGVGGAQGRRGTDRRTLAPGLSFLSREACLQLLEVFSDVTWGWTALLKFK